MLREVARRAHPIDALPVRSAALAALLALLGACADPAPAGPRPDQRAVGPRADGPRALPSWSREALLPSSRLRARGAAPAASADPAALAELLAAAPDAGLLPTGEDGGTAIGTDSGASPTDTPAAPAEDPPDHPRVTIGQVQVQSEMSTPAIEKAARAQLYWPLVQRCRAPDGRMLPPEVITLSFTIDPEGYLVPTSIVATSADPRYEEAAACMRKELSGATFRAPPAARGLTTRVDALVPSID